MLILQPYEDLLKEIEQVFNLLDYNFTSKEETEKFLLLMDKIEEDKANPDDLLNLLNISMVINGIKNEKWAEIKRNLYIQVLCYYAKYYNKNMKLNKAIAINNNPKKDEVVIYMNNLFLVLEESANGPKIRSLFRKDDKGYYWKVEEKQDLLVVIGKIE